MDMKSIKSLTACMAVALLFVSASSEAAVVVTPTTNGNCLPVAPSPHATVSNIILTEGLANDMAIQAGATFILTAPAGFEFNAGSGNVTFTAGRDISTASLSVTTTTITVTYTTTGNTNFDVLRIRNVGVRALAPNIAGQIYRTVAGGTANIAGDAPGGGVNHGSLNASGTGGNIFSIANGNWSNPATWSAGVVPGCTDNVTINHTVNSDLSPSINDLTINTGGNLISDFAVTVSGTFTIAGSGIYTHNNNTVASSTIFNGTESFSTDSKIIVNVWSSYNVPLPTGINGDFGEIEINTAGTWSQRGTFAPARIKNTLTINDGLFNLDNGIGMTTSLTLADVVVTGNGRIQIQTGTARNLTLVTGNFTDISTSASLSSIVYQAAANLDWTVNGDLTLSHRFSIHEGTSLSNVGNANVQVNGDFTIGGGIFDGMKKVVGNLTMTVTGNTTINGNPTTVAFKNYYTGNVTFTSGSMTISNAPAVYVLGNNATVGAATILINGDLSLSGNTTRFYIANNASNANDISLTVTNDIFVTGSQLYTSLSGGNVTVSVGRNYTQSGATSEFYAQRNTAGSNPVIFNVNGSASISDGLFNQSRNLATTTTAIVEILTVQNATFIGMGNNAVGNNGIASLVCSDLNIIGSTFYLHRGYTTDSRTVTVSVTNDINIEFTSSAQEVMFVNRNSDNSTLLDLQVGGNFQVYGTAEGLFCSSVSAGDETIQIGGDMVISAGRVRFNSYENYSTRGHVVTGTISGSLVLSGGSIALSGNRGNANWTITGDYDQTGGYAVCRWYNTGTATVNVMGNMNMSNGTLTMHARAATATIDPVTFTVNGNATFANSTVMFDSCQTSTGEHKLVLKGSSVTYGDNTIFNHAAHLSTRVYFGYVIYDRAGTMTLRRNSSTFDIRQTKQNITAGTTVNFASSPFDLMISSHVQATSSVHTTLTVDGTLNMGTKMITGRAQAGYYAAVTISDGARLRTGHTGGLYSGDATNSCIYPMISGLTRMNFYLGLNSTVEYNGVDNQRMTGTNIGIATTDNHKYGFIEINFAGTPDVEFVYILGTDSATIRNGLILTLGELNLDTDHDPSNGGSDIHLLNNATITRVAGYIRGETYTGTALVRWKINSAGSYVIPFGYNSTSYVPMTFQLTSGNPGTPSFGTNRVAANNTPYPPTITHVNNVVGVDNSASTVDRFWQVDVQGNATANLTFSFTASESTGIVSPRAQLWEPVSRGWFPPSPTQSNPTGTTIQVNGVTSFNNWWAGSASGSPLPIELISFEANAIGNHVKLDWVTATEINNDYFTVERSFTGDVFIPVATVDGAGNSTSPKNYSTTDPAPRNGVNYYRLKQTDFDGRETLSAVRIVNFRKDAPVQIFPNPVIGQVINISATAGEEMVTGISIFDLAGKLIMKKDNMHQLVTADAAKVNIDQQLIQGSYIVEVNTASGTYRERIIKQ